MKESYTITGCIRSPCTYWDNGQHSVSLSILQQNINKGNDLQGLSQSHAVSKDTAKAATGFIPLQRLNKVIIKKSDTTNLKVDNLERVSIVHDTKHYI